MDGLKKDKELILHKIGISPRAHHLIDQSDKLKDSTSLSYREIEDDISGESDRTKNARDQITRLAKRDNFLSPTDHLEVSESHKEDHSTKKKKAIAKKLFEEKERLIREGLKDKVKQMEKDQAEKMLTIALNLDPQKEIERRMREMKRAIEESGDAVTESARSINMSQSYAPSESMGTKMKKRVQFEVTPDKFKSSGRDDTSSQASRQHSSSKVEESIGEDLEIEESIPTSSFGVPSSGPKH